MRRITSTPAKLPSAGNGAPATLPPVSAPVNDAGKLSDAGASITRSLSSPIVRKTLRAAIGAIKRSDIQTPASDPHGRAVERVNAAKLADLATRLADAATALAMLSDASYRDLKGANVGTKQGSVSALALLLAIADASSADDSLAQFAAE